MAPQGCFHHDWLKGFVANSSFWWQVRNLSSFSILCYLFSSWEICILFFFIVYDKMIKYIVKCFNSQKMLRPRYVLRSIKLYFIISSKQIIINFTQAPYFKFQNFWIRNTKPLIILKKRRKEKFWTKLTEWKMRTKRTSYPSTVGPRWAPGSTKSPSADDAWWYRAVQCSSTQAGL